jgi:hypothetical protein
VRAGEDRTEDGSAESSIQPAQPVTGRGSNERAEQLADTRTTVALDKAVKPC